MSKKSKLASAISQDLSDKMIGIPKGEPQEQKDCGPKSLDFSLYREALANGEWDDGIRCSDIIAKNIEALVHPSTDDPKTEIELYVDDRFCGYVLSAKPNYKNWADKDGTFCFVLEPRGSNYYGSGFAHLSNILKPKSDSSQMMGKENFIKFSLIGRRFSTAIDYVFSAKIHGVHRALYTDGFTLDLEDLKPYEPKPENKFEYRKINYKMEFSFKDLNYPEDFRANLTWQMVKDWKDK